MEIKQFISRVRHSLYLKNILTVAFGTSIAQFFPILLLPIISRIYIPEDYGEYALFVSIVGIIAIFVTGHYNYAIMLPKETEAAVALMDISFSINIVVSSMVFCGSLIYSFVSQKFIYILIPLPVFIAGMNTMLSIWNNRSKNYKIISASNVLSGILVPCLQIGLFFFMGGKGLIIAYIISQLLVCIFLLIKTSNLHLHLVNYKNNISLLYRYRSFVYQKLPSAINNSLAVQLPTFLMTSFVGAIPTGNFNFSNRLLGVPLQLLSSSIGEVFKQSAIESKHKDGNCKRIFIKTLLLLSSIALPIFIILLLFAPQIFSIVFGTAWSEAGHYVQILCLLFFVRFVVSPLSYVLIAVERLGEDLFIQILKMVLSVIGLVCGYLVYRTPEGMLLFYMTGYFLAYIYEFFRSYVASL